MKAGKLELTVAKTAHRSGSTGLFSVEHAKSIKVQFKTQKNSDCINSSCF
jgi:hypothetical protein